MSLTFNEHWEEIDVQLQKPQVLSLSKDNNVLMTLTWDDGEQKILSIWEFLDLTDIETAEVEKLFTPLWFTLVGQRTIGQDYPEYFKDFHDANPSLFVDGKEMFLQRDQFKADTSDVIFPDREKRELIFVKLNLPTPTPEVVVENTISVKKVIGEILLNLWQTK